MCFIAASDCPLGLVVAVIGLGVAVLGLTCATVGLTASLLLQRSRLRTPGRPASSAKKAAPTVESMKAEVGSALPQDEVLRGA